MTKNERLSDAVECQSMARQYYIEMVKARDKGEHYAACKYQREACYWAEDARYIMSNLSEV